MILPSRDVHYCTSFSLAPSPADFAAVDSLHCLLQRVLGWWVGSGHEQGRTERREAAGHRDGGVRTQRRERLVIGMVARKTQPAAFSALGSGPCEMRVPRAPMSIYLRILPLLLSHKVACGPQNCQQPHLVSQKPHLPRRSLNGASPHRWLLFFSFPSGLYLRQQRTPPWHVGRASS